MVQRCSWFVVAFMIVSGAFGFAVRAEDVPASAAAAETSAEAGLDLTLRSNAAAMPAKTADGSAMESAASHVYLVDYDTGSVLVDKASTVPMYPSSMTKIMTLYVVFEQLKSGALTLANEFTVSEKAWRMQGSKMFVPLGSQIPLEELIRGIAVQSGNDACVVVAEGIAGSEEAFAKQMNDSAKAIGMSASNFVDASGWPHPNHTTTAHDLGVLAVHIIRDFPEYYHYLSEREFTFHGIRQFNRNLLLGNASLKVDGLKTGHTEAAGYGITLSAVDPSTKRRLVLVINGLDSEAARAQEGERLLKWGFANFKNITPFAAGQPITPAKVWMGNMRELPLTVAENIQLTVPKTGKSATKAVVNYQSPLIAPISKGQEIGKLTLTHADGSIRNIPLVAGADVAKLSFPARAARALGF